MLFDELHVDDRNNSVQFSTQHWLRYYTGCGTMTCHVMIKFSHLKIKPTALKSIGSKFYTIPVLKLKPLVLLIIYFILSYVY